MNKNLRIGFIGTDGKENLFILQQRHRVLGLFSFWSTVKVSHNYAKLKTLKNIL